MRIINTALVVLSVSAGLADSIPSDSHRLTLEDIVSVEGIGESAVSPDGKTIAIVRSGQIALLSSERGLASYPDRFHRRKVRLVAGPPDGRKIAFSSQGSVWTVCRSQAANRRG